MSMQSVYSHGVLSMCHAPGAARCIGLELVAARRVLRDRVVGQVGAFVSLRVLERTAIVALPERSSVAGSFAESAGVMRNRLTRSCCFLGVAHVAHRIHGKELRQT